MKLRYFFKPEWVPSAVKIALLVGTLLFVINHGVALLNGSMTSGRWISVVLSYVVPYSVYMIGRMSHLEKD